MVYHGPMQNLGDMNRMPLSPLRNNPCATDPCGSLRIRGRMRPNSNVFAIFWSLNSLSHISDCGSTGRRSRAHCGFGSQYDDQHEILWPAWVGVLGCWIAGQDTLGPSGNLIAVLSHDTPLKPETLHRFIMRWALRGGWEWSWHWLVVLRRWRSRVMAFMDIYGNFSHFLARDSAL